MTLWFVLTFNFFLFRVLPGDPVAIARAERAAHPRRRRPLQHDLGLDLPMAAAVRRSTCENTLTGNLGESLRTGEQVKRHHRRPDVADRAARRPGHAARELVRRPDRDPRRVAARQPLRHDARSTALSSCTRCRRAGWACFCCSSSRDGCTGSLPAGTRARTRPASPQSGRLLDHLFLPLLTLTLGYIGGYSIVMRSSMIDTTNEDFVQTARAKGVPDRLVRQNATSCPTRSCRRSR